MNDTSPTNVNVVITLPRKSLLLSLILTIFFGPLGMLYTTVIGALIMLALSGVVGFLTMGYGLIVTYLISIIWGVLAAGSHNRKLAGAVEVRQG